MKLFKSFIFHRHCRIYLCLFILCFLAMPPIFANELIVGTWGGSYEETQRKTLFLPYELETANKVKTQLYLGGLDFLRGANIPDVLDMTEEDALLACEQGLIKPYAFITLLDPSTKKEPANIDFMKNAIQPCGVAHLHYATLIAFDDRAFKGEKPSQIADFFDIERFPGKRALHQSPTALLEWALMAEGAPKDQIYDLLSTDRGIRLALRRLDKIRDHIIWWKNPEQPVQWLQSQKVVMTSGFNGRFFNAQNNGSRISMLWDGQIISKNMWVFPNSTSPPSIAAKQFIRRATQPQRMARLAENIPYSPTRLSAIKLIGSHATTGTPMQDHLPTTAHHLNKAIISDAKWYAYTRDFRQRRFEQWLNQHK